MKKSSRNRTIALVAIVLFVLHYDFWYWDDASLLWGFMPIGLAWHAGLSILASIAWLGCVLYAWPAEIEEWADEEGGA